LLSRASGKKPEGDAQLADIIPFDEEQRERETVELSMRDEAVARELAYGTSADDICTLFDLTINGLRALEKKAAVQEHVARWKDRRRVILQQRAHMTDFLLGKALRVLEEDLDKPDSRTRVTTARAFAEPFIKAQFEKDRPELSISIHSQNAALVVGDKLRELIDLNKNQPAAPSLDDDDHFVT
jgi:hypothetical protein